MSTDVSAFVATIVMPYNTTNKSAEHASIESAKRTAEYSAERAAERATFRAAFDVPFEPTDILAVDAAFGTAEHTSIVSAVISSVDAT